MSFFEDKLYQLIEELGREGIGGHEKVEERERGFEKSGSPFETALGEFNDEVEESLSGDDFSFRRSLPELGLGGLKWRRVRSFFNDLETCSVEMKSAGNQQFWRRREKWEFEWKLTLS